MPAQLDVDYPIRWCRATDAGTLTWELLHDQLQIILLALTPRKCIEALQVLFREFSVTTWLVYMLWITMLSCHSHYMYILLAQSQMNSCSNLQLSIDLKVLHLEQPTWFFFCLHWNMDDDSSDGHLTHDSNDASDDGQWLDSWLAPILWYHSKN